jgi:hypothetical protein
MPEAATSTIAIDMTVHRTFFVSSGIVEPLPMSAGA